MREPTQSKEAPNKTENNWDLLIFVCSIEADENKASGVGDEDSELDVVGERRCAVGRGQLSQQPWERWLRMVLSKGDDVL